MQDIIQKIIEIDKNAQKMTEEARQSRLEAEKAVHAEMDKLRSEYLERAHARIRKTQATEEAFQMEALKEIERKHNVTADSLRGMYEQNREKWVDQLFNRVIGG